MSARESSDESGLVFLLDVDNTLLDNDRLKADLSSRLQDLLGDEGAKHFWDLYETVRRQEDFVDYPETVKRWVEETGDTAKGEQLVQVMNAIDFPSYLFPGVMKTLAHLRSLGTTAVLSDGDSVFQPRKIRESGIEQAVGGNVLIYVHKELELPEVFARLPARHYVMIDDKPRILSELEKCCPATFTTVLVLQGKYAQTGRYSPPPDYVVPHIAGLQSFTRNQFLYPRDHAERGEAMAT